MHARIMNDSKFVTEKATCWLNNDTRRSFFRQAISFINYEKVEGDILEFGVGIGKSLALLSLTHEEDKKYWHYNDPITVNRNIIGFDAFEGLPDFNEHHPRWKISSFHSNYELYHPWLRWEEKFSETTITELFSLLQLPAPSLIKGWFADTLPEYIEGGFKKTPLVHIDCDVYESAITVLLTIEPLLQSGTLLLFDDYFCYKGNPDKGEARALKEFTHHFPHWHLIPYHAYSTFGNSFILHDARTT